jgi:V/A-type H+-transporting ATPase subunit I
MTNFMGYESTAAAKEAVPFFNGLAIALGGEPVSLNPLENPMTFLVISLAMGALHLLAGMAIKFVVMCKQGDVFAAIFDIGSWWLVFGGIGLLFLNSTVGLVTLGIGVLMIVATAGRSSKNPIVRFLKGLLGLYSIVNYASDLLSYSRILALGLTAGVIAQVINVIATMGGPTPGGFILLVIMMLVGHALNIAINVLGSFVHTSRLQYLEFFGKFYEDGGTAFEPALPSDQYSTVELDTTEETQPSEVQ